MPDIVIGGINHGYNLSSDTIYSGTCGVARQGAMYGIPGIAISAMCDENGNYDFESPAEYLASNLEYFYQALIGAEAFLNINFPPRWNGNVEKASLGVIHYDDLFSIKVKVNKISVKTSGCDMSAVPSPESEGYDMDSVVTQRGAASITFVEITPGYDKERMNKLRV